LEAHATFEKKRTYITERSSFGLLNTSKPPNFHSPEGVIKTAFGRTFPWVDEAESLRKASATWLRISVRP
jgi:hypothetical protein